MATEKRLIDANALLEAIKFEHDRIMQDPEVSNNMKWCEAVCNHRATEAIERSLTVEAVEVVHGRWVDNGITESVLSKCSVCGFLWGADSFNYCPNCGADMRGSEE